MTTPRSAALGLRAPLLACVAVLASCTLVADFGDFLVLDAPDGDSDVDSDSDSDSDGDPCVPDCEGRECGPDGCGGACEPGCPLGVPCNEAEGRCDPDCVPYCEGRECGFDGCGGTCEPGCTYGERCEDGLCVRDCEPDCAGRECGPDGCGGSCEPGCPDGAYCDEASGRCIPTSCEPGSVIGAPCASDGVCWPSELACFQPPVGSGPGVCSARCEVDSDCPLGETGEVPRCVDTTPHLEVPGWCLFDCGESGACPCDIRCVGFEDIGVDICYP